MKFEKYNLLETKMTNKRALMEDEEAIEAEKEAPESSEEEDFDWEARLDEWTGGKYELNMENLEDALDWLYITNKENLEDAEGGYFQPVNLLVLGNPGGGKSSIIEDWAKNRRKDVALLELTGGELTSDLVKGIPFDAEVEDPRNPGKTIHVQKLLPSTAFDDLDDPKGRYTVLFLDELNRSFADAEAAILSLIQSHSISNSNYLGNRRHFDKFLFTVAACNPPTTNKEVRKLSLALNTRFRFFNWENSISTTADFWIRQYERRIENVEKKFAIDKNQKVRDRKINKYSGKIEILKALRDSDEFVFSDSEENGAAAAEGKLVMNARTLGSALETCDGTVGSEIGVTRDGSPKYTQGSFLGEFSSHCGDTFLDLVEEILSPVAEAQNAANGFQSTVYDKFLKWQKKAKKEGKIS